MLPTPKLLSQGQWWDIWWSPWRGCTKAGRACDHCWAKRLIEGRLKRYNYCPKGFWAGPVYQGDKEMLKPLRWRQPRVVGVCGFSDLFHETISFQQIDRVFAVMALCPQHLFIIPTKRAERALQYFGPRHGDFRWGPINDAARKIARKRTITPADRPPRNVWLLASIWDQASADRMIPELLKCPAALRGISYEPALGAVFLRQNWTSRLGFIIAGGESGKDYRADSLGWYCGLRDTAHRCGIPFYMKQLAGNTKAKRQAIPDDLMIRHWPAKDGTDGTDTTLPNPG